MAFIPVPDVWHCVLRFTATGLRPKTMGFYIQDGLGDDSPARAEQLASEVEAWADSHLDASYGPGLTLSNVQMRSMNVPNGTVLDKLVNVPGTNVGAGMPGNVAFCISFRTGKAGKSFRGRVYHPWLSEAEVTGNSLAQARADAIVSAWENLDALLVLLDGYMSVVSFYTGKAPRTQGYVSRITNYLYVDLNVDTQRRRVRPL